MDLNELIQAEELQLHKLRELVQSSLKEEELLSQRLFELENDSEITLTERLADKVADFGGSWVFIIVFLASMFAWICINTFAVFSQSFDPYPYILLNLILSCIAALQAPVIMMSQNRQEEKDRRRARSDFMVNMKSEIEVRSLHQKMDLLMADQMQHLFKIQQAQLELLQRLEKAVATKTA